ncbi:hypothetical protein [Streptomyces canus]|uniref:hypothetical protein n=1 Tax=Streptomyces canus TaxID=58343 RepID=UPI003719DDC3
MDDRQNSLPFRRLSVAVAGAAALVALSVGGAIAANSDDGPSAEPSVSTTLPPDEGGTDGGTVGGSGGTDPSPTSTSPDVPPVTDEPSAPSELAELNRRIAELDKKVDELPTKKELADALRAFADQLDKPAAPGDPGGTEEPTADPQPTDSLPPN